MGSATLDIPFQHPGLPSRLPGCGGQLLRSWMKAKTFPWQAAKFQLNTRNTFFSSRKNQSTEYTIWKGRMTMFLQFGHVSAWYDTSRGDPRGEGVRGSEGVLSSVGRALALGFLGAENGIGRNSLNALISMMIISLLLAWVASQSKVCSLWSPLLHLAPLLMLLGKLGSNSQCWFQNDSQSILSLPHTPRPS